MCCRVRAGGGLLAACGDGKEGAADDGAGGEEKILHVYNWTDYIGRTTIADFEAKTGIQVVYDTYDSNELLETKLLTGDQRLRRRRSRRRRFLERLTKAGVFLKLDKSKLAQPFEPGPGHHATRLPVNDPGNDHAIDYMWGMDGLGYNPAMVRKALGTGTHGQLERAVRPDHCLEPR